MPWITPRSIPCFLLFMLYSQTGRCCEKRFSKDRFDAVIPSQVSKGEAVLTVKFHDCHLGKRIQLSTNDANFEIHSNGSLYATHTLNIDATYHLKVIAKDRKTNESWKATVHLNPSAKDLTNKGNEAIKRICPTIYFPKANKSRRQKREWIIPPFAIRENQWPINNPIAIIRSDKETNENIFYSIEGPSLPADLFVIDHRTGELNITRMVDRERNPFFELIGKAKDTRNQEVEKRLTLHIEVEDENDNAPVFTQQVFQGAVEELSPFDTFVLKLNATDADIGENAEIAYRIVSEESINLFSARSNGEIRTMGTNLDREIQDLYTLTVEGRDLNGNRDGKSSTAKAQIRILDVNDNIPIAEKMEYEVSVEENSLNDEVIRIKVFDKDQEFTDNWLGHFEIIEGNEMGHFRFEVDEQTNEGILVLHKELDYEESQIRNLILRISNKAQYHSSIISGGGGGGGGGISKPIKIKVNVKDKKEGFSFKPTTKRISITEDRTKIKIGESFGKYPAISADTGKESERTRYAKNTDLANYFNINPETGEITLNKLPDRESEYIVDGKYTMTILAIDSDGPVPKTATGTIVFDVDDENDNIPIISNLQPCMCENARSLTITAFDADSYPNAAPYNFKLVDEPGVTNKWKILRRNDTSAELQPLIDLWPHTFKVPIKVEDKQGSGKVHNVDVNVIECTDNDLSCYPVKERQTSSKNASLGASAIGFMVLGALLLLLAPLLLLFCNCGLAGGGQGLPGHFKQIPIEPLGYLENNNIEGGGETDTSIPLLPADASGAAVKSISGEVDGFRGKSSQVNLSGGSENIHSGGSFAHKTINSMSGYTSCMRDMSKHVFNGNMSIKGAVAENSYKTANKRTLSGSSFKGYVESYMNEKLFDCSAEDQACPARDCLLIYNHEGEGSPVGSLGSCSLIGDELQFKDSDLDDLGPKFKTLADICVGKFESETSTINVDLPVQQNFTRTERSISSSSGGLQGLGIIADPPLMHKNYIVTTTINPVTEVLPDIADPSVAHQNVIMTKQVNASAGGMPAMIIDPSITHQNVIMTKQVNASAGGMPAMIIDPSVVHQNVMMTKQVHDAGTMQGINMMADPSFTHQNVVVTKSVNVSSGGTQGMIVDPSLPQLPVVHKNVTLNRSVHSGTGEMQNMIIDSPLDQIPVIHKNVTLTRPAHAAAVPLVQRSSSTRKSVTSTNDVHKTVTKVTKVTQVMQE
ncbi:desmoglein-2-like [Carcharodon carcharias]|uniref:desmoglein-2-like n=1 Tax=Carcharodon carcharias TaxID=13397 RepID=UPI001B7E116D|nr:desmoglein-2-like [Carcharodon carcharias]